MTTVATIAAEPTRPAFTEARSVEFFVAGTPQQKGSTKSFMCSTTGRIRTKSANPKLEFWESNVRTVAAGKWEGAPGDGPVHVEVTFFFERPQGHHGTGRNAGRLKGSAPKEHIKCPDLDKLIRGLLDGLTEVVFKDDRQVNALTADKRYLKPGAGHGPGALVAVREV